LNDNFLSPFTFILTSKEGCMWWWWLLVYNKCRLGYVRLGLRNRLLPIHTPVVSGFAIWQLPLLLKCLLDYIFITYLLGISYFWILSSVKKFSYTYCSAVQSWNIYLIYCNVLNSSIPNYWAFRMLECRSMINNNSVKVFKCSLKCSISVCCPYCRYAIFAMFSVRRLTLNALYGCNWPCTRNSDMLYRKLLNSFLIKLDIFVTIHTRTHKLGHALA
jgi:hypothetical protein